MKALVFLLLFLMLSNTKAICGTPARFVVDDAGSRVEFAIATVGGVEVFTEDELSAVFNLHRFKNMDSEVKNCSPTAFEKYLAESGIKFDSMDDFRKCVDNKDYLDDKLMDMKPSQLKRKKAKIDAIKAENSKR